MERRHVPHRPHRAPVGAADRPDLTADLRDDAIDRRIAGLNVVEAGPVTGEPVVLVHGIVCSAYSWRHQIPALAGAGFRVIVPELPGHGDSPVAPSKSGYTTDAMRDALVALLRAREVKRPHLVGHSMGAAIVLDIAAVIETRSVSLMAPAGLGDVNQLWLWRLISLLPLGRLIARISLPRWVFTAGLRLVYGRRVQPSAATIDEYWRRGRREGHAAAIWYLLRAFDWEPRDAEQLANITSPACVIYGDADIMVRTRNIRERARDLANTSIHVVHDAGHLVIEEAPDEVNAHLIARIRGKQPMA